ncbi:uncharacterized protein LOC132203529 [Neocloeon triangulifer]|uniref:uncharacterized protein LOC132203529 n=1 Tax=Neocloeon triangulifer TaxID=2078957 RepID=UPI00286F70DF|nr:uncharacterized protein LOC132203529 [Neocloeon triangulifer]
MDQPQPEQLFDDTNSIGISNLIPLDGEFFAKLFSQPIYVQSSEPGVQQPPEEQSFANDTGIQILGEPISLQDLTLEPKKSSSKGTRRKRVVVNKKRTAKKAKRKSSSSASMTEDSHNSSQESSPPQIATSSKIEPGQTASLACPTESAKNTTVCRFQCKVCGQARFLVLRGCLPLRQCECGSSAVFVPCWVRTGSSSSGGGLGRECTHCPRCCRFYSSDSQLRRHKCSKQTAGPTVPVGPTGVFEMPCCPHCNECFIFDSQLATHLRREHRPEKN